MPYCFTGITRVEQHHNPDEGRNIWNNNFEAVGCALVSWATSANTGQTVVVSNDDNIQVAVSGVSVPTIYTVGMSNDINVTSISAGTIYSGSTNLYDIFGVGGTSGDLWSASTGTNSIIANNGSGNIAGGTSAIIAGGNENFAGGQYSFVGGGAYNVTVGDGSFAGSGEYSSIAGGNNNTISPNGSFIGAGTYNTISGSSNYSSIIGGSDNLIFNPSSRDATAGYSSIAGGNNNTINSNRSFIGAGTYNTIEGDSSYSSIIGGSDNKISNSVSTVIAGGQGITATTSYTLYAENFNLKKSFDAGFLAIGTTTLTTGYVILGFTGTTGGTVTISSSDVVMGRMFIIKDQGGNAGTNNIVIDTEGVETIDGAASVTITANYGVARLYSDGSNLFTW